MTYSSGGLIQASDYNGFAGGNVGANVSGQLNTVLGTGYGNAGYGQVGVSNVTAVSDTVTAAQWTSLFGGIDRVRSHQSLTYSNIGIATSGDLVAVKSAVTGNLTSAYTNRLVQRVAGTTVTGSTFTANFNYASTTSALQGAFTRTVTFESADKARYFFNAGGSVNFVIVSATNNDAFQRGLSICNLVWTGFGSDRVYGGNVGGVTGNTTPYTVVVNRTSNYGYYVNTTSNVTIANIAGSSYGATYGSDYMNFYTKTSGTSGSYGDKGNTMYLSVLWNSGAQSPAFNDGVNISIAHRVDVTYPSTTFLANTWGAVTVS